MWGWKPLDVMWQNETESEPLVAVEVCCPRPKLSLNVLNEVAQVVIICVSTVVLYCQIFAFVFKAGIWPGCRCASDHISETAYRFAMPLAGEL